MKNIHATTVVGAALLSVLGAGMAHADSFTGSKGDQNARAFALDSSPNPMTRPSDPAGMARTICAMRSKGLSEQALMTQRWLGDAPTSWIPAAEWHFCPNYYAGN